jgi:hypothetical protein
MGNARDALNEKSIRKLIESIDDVDAALTPLTVKIESQMAPMFEPFGKIQSVVEEVAGKILPALGQDRTARLLELSQTAVARGLRVSLAQNFRTHKLRGILDLRDIGEASLTTVIGDFLKSLKGALSTLLPPGEGRRIFTSLTNISGLYGLTITAGETLVLYVDDPNVQKLISSGALEEISAAEGAAS